MVVAWINLMSFLIDRHSMYRNITLIKGASLSMSLFLGKMILSGLILIIVHRRFVGSLVLNIISSSTYFLVCVWSEVDCMPVRL